MTGRNTGATGEQFVQYIIETVQRSDPAKVWQAYVDKAATFQ